MNRSSHIGKKGELIAAAFLEEKGFKIVARNYRRRRGEIDLIVRRDDWLIFVEVKTRTSTDFGEPEEFVDLKKARKIYDAAEEFIYSTDWHGHVRFDVISIMLGETESLRYFEDAIN